MDVCWNRIVDLGKVSEEFTSSYNGMWRKVFPYGM